MINGIILLLVGALNGTANQVRQVMNGDLPLQDGLVSQTRVLKRVGVAIGGYLKSLKIGNHFPSFIPKKKSSLMIGKDQ